MTTTAETRMTFSKAAVERANRAMVSSYRDAGSGQFRSHKAAAAVEGLRLSREEIGRALDAALRNRQRV